MAIIYQHDKRSGITYAYESKSFWDKEKKMTRAKRTLIGRLDPNTGEITPTDGRGRRDKTITETTKDLDYKKLYEKLKRQCAAQDSLITTLQKELQALKEGK